MADHLTLFRHSNLKGMFEGSCIATRQSMERTLGHIRIKLRYWERKTDGARWYGFRAVGQCFRCLDPCDCVGFNIKSHHRSKTEKD